MGDQLDGLLEECNIASVADLLVAMGLGLVGSCGYNVILDAWHRVAAAANALGGPPQTAASKLAGLLEGIVGEDVDRSSEQIAVSDAENSRPLVPKPIHPKDSDLSQQVGG